MGGVGQELARVGQCLDECWARVRRELGSIGQGSQGSSLRWCWARLLTVLDEGYMVLNKGWCLDKVLKGVGRGLGGERVLECH